MVNWVIEIYGYVTLKDVSDDRIIALIPVSQGDVRNRIGSDLYNTLAANEDPTWKQAVCQFLISRLLLAVRDISQGQALPDTKGFGVGWGDGTIRPAASDDLLKMSNNWRTLADEAVALIIKENVDTNADPVGWYDI